LFHTRAESISEEPERKMYSVRRRANRLGLRPVEKYRFPELFSSELLWFSNKVKLQDGRLKSVHLIFQSDFKGTRKEIQTTKE